MKDIFKNIRNVVVFGIILYVINYALNFIIDKICDLCGLDSLYDINIVIYAIITIGLGIILYLIAMVMTKKIMSIKLKLYYEEAKRMLLILLIIFLTLSVIEFFFTFNSSLKVEKELNATIAKLEEIRTNKDYKLYDKSTRNTVESMYEMYIKGKDQILELENQKRTLNVVELISDVFLYMVCLYAFGLFLYRND